MPNKSELPAIDQLAATPDVMRMVLDGISEGEANTRPAPDQWSIAEVLEHLSHAEGYSFRARIDQIVNEETPQLAIYDEEELARAGQYSGGDAEDSFAHWEEQREVNVEYLRSLPVGAGIRAGIHPTVGEVTLNALLHDWAYHDLGHLHQIIELIRSVRYFPKLGPLQKVRQPRG